MSFFLFLLKWQYEKLTSCEMKDKWWRMLVWWWLQIHCYLWNNFFKPQDLPYSTSYGVWWPSRNSQCPTANGWDDQPRQGAGGGQELPGPLQICGKCVQSDLNLVIISYPRLLMVWAGGGQGLPGPQQWYHHQVRNTVNMSLIYWFFYDWFFWICQKKYQLQFL